MALNIDEEFVKELLRDIKFYFKDRLGKNTHKKASEDWRFYGLAFTREDIIYVFGINIGFFREQNEENYNMLGMNVLVRTNGEKQSERRKYLEFFREQLKDWINRPEGVYTSDRGGEGVEFARYKHIDEFESADEMKDFLKECVDNIHPVYYTIVENPDNIFDKVVYAAPQWQNGIIEFCKQHIE